MVSAQTQRRLLHAKGGPLFESSAAPYARWRLPYPEFLTNPVAALAHNHIAAPRMSHAQPCGRAMSGRGTLYGTLATATASASP